MNSVYNWWSLNERIVTTFTVYNENFEDIYGAIVSYSCHFLDL